MPKKSFFLNLAKFKSVILSQNLKRRPSYLEKNVFSNKVNKVIILSTGETLGEVFATNAHRSYFTLFAYFHLHLVLDKIPTWKLFTLVFMENQKQKNVLR